MRIDISKDNVPKYKQRVEGRKFVWVDNHKWMNMKPILKLIKEEQRKQRSSRR